MSCVTQNVNGFGSKKAQRGEWLRTFRRNDRHGRFDIVLLQETHIGAEEVAHMEADYATTWGFRTGANCPRRSFWAPAHNCKGGVAILLDLYGQITDARPVLESAWSPNFMAITGTCAGAQFLFLCVYAPHQRARREKFFRELVDLDLPDVEKIIMGGDFNCTLDAALDRSYFRRSATHTSPALTNLLAQWALVDALQAPPDLPPDGRRAWHAATHTYRYPLPSGTEATARLDRWYGSAQLLDWFVKVEVGHPGTHADHQMVRLHTRPPTDPIRIRKSPRAYPCPEVATSAVKCLMEERLAEYMSTLPEQSQVTSDAASEWDTFKACLRKDTLTLIRQRRRSSRASLTQKLKRLLRQESRLMEEANGNIPTVASITDSMAALSLAEGKGATPIQRVRNAITECIRAKFALRGRQRFWTGAYTAGKTTKTMFQRVSTKFANHDIHRLDAARGERERGVHDKADTLADAWTPIFQQHGSTAADRAEALMWLGPAGQYTRILSGLDAPITAAEVAAAIGASKPGKACGPDGFGNDWYRDFSDFLIPILTTLYNVWISAGSFPQSFLEADIFCLSKGGDTKNPLNYRPLALLDSDYKIYTRVLTSRTRSHLRWIIHPNQNGFVPFRVIHDTIDLFSAAKVMAAADPALSQAMALLLDFRKAYDSVDREFLYQVLEWLGFPARFVATIRGLHEGTRVRFLANGSRSRWIDVTCGIRQGCPLAPLLFILVLEAFYRRIDRDEHITGIVLRSQEGQLTLKVAGYADDTACYVRTEGEVTIILIIARKFAVASGLLLNEEKTLIIALRQDTSQTMPVLPAPLIAQATTHLARYLGIQMGSQDGTTDTWQLARRQLTTRLALAVEKTMTVDHRSQLAAAIIIPKLLFIGRHCWPTATVVNQFQKMIKNFIWHAQFTSTTVEGRAWLNTHVAHLPRRDGGLAIPDLKTELLAMAAATAHKWALLAPQEARIVGDILATREDDRKAACLTISPSQTTHNPRGPRFGANLLLAGAQVCARHGTVGQVTNKAKMVRALAAMLYFKGPLSASWRGRRLTLELQTLHGTVCQAYIQAEFGHNGTFCGEWLPYVSFSSLRLYSEEGEVINPNTQFRAICAQGTLLKDVLHWRWSPPNRMVVTALCPRLTNGARRQIGKLMTLLLINFPSLLRPGDHSGDVRYGLAEDGPAPLPRFRISLGGILTGYGTSADNETGRKPLTSHRDLTDQLAGLLGPDRVLGWVHPHPRISRLVCLWVGKRRWSGTKAGYRARIAARSRQKAVINTKAASAKCKNVNRTAARGLDTIQWSSIRRIVGLNPWGEQLLLRIKQHALSTYNPVSAGLGCPHDTCLRVGRVTLFHIFWSCPAAFQLRQVLLPKWRAAGLRLDSYVESIFSLTLPSLPSTLMLEIGQTLTDLGEQAVTDTADIADRLVEGCWRLGAALYLLGVWRWRVAHFHELNDTSEGHHVAGLGIRLRAGYTHIVRSSLDRLDEPVRSRLSLVLRQWMGAAWSRQAELERPVGAHHHTLVFVGGDAKGEAAQAGAGILIAQVASDTGQYVIHYMLGQVLRGRSATATVVSHVGLLKGLRLCRAHGWRHVHVIGDASPVIQQHVLRRAPKRKGVQGYYWQARRLADALSVASWTVQAREYNTAARTIAMVAKNTGHDVEWNAIEFPHAGEKWAAVSARVTSDVAYWLAGRHESSSRPLETGTV